MLKTIKNNVAPILILISGFIYDILFQLRHGIELLNSDYATEILIADYLNKTKSLALLKDFYYGTEIRVFEIQWFYRPWLILFPNNWHLVRTLGMASVLIVLVIAILLACKACKLEKYGWWIAAFSMWPLGYWYMYLFTFGSFYVPYAIFSFFSLFLLVKLLDEENKKRKIVFTILLALIAYLSGLNGVRQFMVYYAPVFLASIIMLFYKSKKTLKVFAYSFGSLFVNCLGILTNLTYISNNYYFDNQSGLVWDGGSESWLTSLKWLVEIFGYVQNHASGLFNTGGITPLFSFSGIGMGCGLLVGFAVVISAVYLICRFKSLSFVEQFLTLSILSMVFVIGVVLTYAYGTMQYWVQTIPFGFMLIALAIKNMPRIEALEYIKINENLQRQLILITGAVFIIISSIGTADSLVSLPYEEYTKIGLVDVVDWIRDNTDYRTGVSDYWNCNVVTGLTNGDIEMYNVLNPFEPDDLSWWHQKQSHLQELDNLHHYFVLAEYDEAGAANSYLSMDDIIYFDGKYAVYGIE